MAAVQTAAVSDVVHRGDEYDPAGFDTLWDMQARHFWYQGRHRFLWTLFARTLKSARLDEESLKIIDIGGGCGGWVKRLLDRGLSPENLALADSSRDALDYAARLFPPNVGLHQEDILHLPWRNHWDVVFLLDVLEHIPQEEDALREIHAALKPGGLLFITTPALQRFWSWNDEVVHHCRRYSRQDYQRLARTTGYEFGDARYFMFFLSPLLLLSRRLQQPDLSKLSVDEQQALIARTHRVPSPFVNATLGTIFAAETPLGHLIPFPWGTSVAAVLRKPL